MKEESLRKQTREWNPRSKRNLGSEAVIEFTRSCSLLGESGGAGSWQAKMKCCRICLTTVENGHRRAGGIEVLKNNSLGNKAWKEQVAIKLNTNKSVKQIKGL